VQLLYLFAGEIEKAVGDSLLRYLEEEISWYAVLCFRVIGNGMEVAFLHSCVLFGLLSLGLMAGFSTNFVLIYGWPLLLQLSTVLCCVSARRCCPFIGTRIAFSTTVH